MTALGKLDSLPPGGNSGNAIAVHPAGAYLVHWSAPGVATPVFFAMQRLRLPGLEIIASEVVPGLAPAASWEPRRPTRSSASRSLRRCEMSEFDDQYRQVLQMIDAHDIELIRFLWVDHNGIVRGKAVTRRFLESRMASGIGLAKSRQAASLMDIGQPVPGFDAVGEVRLVPDPKTFVALPHAPGSEAMLCDLVQLDSASWDACRAPS